MHLEFCFKCFLMLLYVSLCYNFFKGVWSMKKLLLIVLLCGGILCLTGCGKSSSEEDKNNLEQGFVEKETVEVLVSKFNKEVLDDSSLNVASNDYLTEDNEQYWYGLFEGVSLVVVPEKYTKDKAKDIVDYMIIYVDKTSKYIDKVLPYTKYLIKANNSEITGAQIDKLLEDAIDLSKSGKTANNGKGISVGYLEKDSYYQYQVLRLYK